MKACLFSIVVSIIAICISIETLRVQAQNDALYAAYAARVSR